MFRSFKMVNYSERLSMTLKGKCHNTGCRNNYNCPQHCRCGAKLDMSTAVIWQIAKVLSSNLREPKIKYEIIRGLTSALSLHRDRYPNRYELASKAMLAYNCLMDMEYGNLDPDQAEKRFFSYYRAIQHIKRQK